MVVGDMFSPGTCEWDTEVIDEAFSAADRERIYHTTPPPQCNVDKLVWHHSPTGVYTVNNAYHFAGRLVNGVHAYEESPWKTIWNIRIPPKVRTFYWRLCKGWITVRSKLRKWYPTIEVTCPNCEQIPETIWHLFVDCIHARECWGAGNLWHKIDALCYHVEGSEDLFLSLLRHLERDELERAMMIVWSIWRGRNSIIWNDIRDTPSRQVFAAMTTLVEWQAIHKVVTGQSRTDNCRRWHAPCLGYVKVNVDVAFYEDSLEIGVGMIIHDDKGEFICCRSLVRQGVVKVDEGGAWGIVEAIRWAVNLGFELVIVESDSKRVIDAMKLGTRDYTVLSDFIDMGRNLLQENENFTISWTCRNANGLAHCLARTSRDYSSPHCWVEPLDSVVGLLDKCFSCS